MNSIAMELGRLHPSLAALHGLPLFVFLAVFVLTALFLLGYAVKGTQVWWQLSSALRIVKALRSNKTPPSPKDVGKAFKVEPLRHLWDEYADTLHELRKAGSGAAALTEIRATVPAEAMFTRDVLVDSRLFDDFTRHLPGVLTGLGIVGTFAGLLDGLASFKPTPIEDAVNGLTPLLLGVQHAFIASGAAIAAAMLVVFISKLTLAYLYRLVEHLTHAIDSLYSTGAGEEYLARLVKSSEQNAATTAQLKDALVEDLNKMMTNLVERQIASHEASTVALGKHLGETISTALAEPMKRVSDAVEVTSKGNGEQVNSMLETLLTGFMAKLEDTFGGQMRGINEQMQRSMDSMSAVQASMQGLVSDIQQTNKQAANEMSGALGDAMKKAADNQQLLTDQMREFVQEFRRLASEEQSKSKQAMDDAVMKVLGEVALAMDGMEQVRKSSAADDVGRNARMSTQLEDAMKKAADNQQLLTDQMREFVQEFRRLASEEQSKSKQAMDDAVMKVLGEVALAMDGMEQVRKTSAADEVDRSDRLSTQTNQLVGGLATQVESLLGAVSDQVVKTQSNIDALGQVSLQAIDGMNQGALTMGTAAQRFETAGGAVITVLDRSTKVTESLTGASASLQAASTAVQRGFEQYDSTRKTVDTQVAALMGLIESAKKEAGISQELVASIKASAEAMRRAEADSREHLDQVNDALVKAFTDFGTSMVGQVKSTIAETDRHLANGTGHLNGVVQELAIAVQRMKRA